MTPAAPRTTWVFRLMPLGCAACLAGCVLVGPNYVGPTASRAQRTIFLAGSVANHRNGP
jgi:hypothetical protein